MADIKISFNSPGNIFGGTAKLPVMLFLTKLYLILTVEPVGSKYQKYKNQEYTMLSFYCCVSIFTLGLLRRFWR